MANTNKWELSPVAEAANIAGEEKRQRERNARRSNAEKQRTFRANMKTKGFKEVKVWEKPPSPGMVKPWEGTAPVIHKGTLGVCRRNKYAHAAVREMQRAFLEEIEKEEKKVTPDGWRIYQDINVLLSPLGYSED